MQSTKRSGIVSKNIVSDKEKTQTQGFIVRIQQIVLWWHCVWLGIIISVVVYYLELTSSIRLASAIGFTIIGIFSYKAYRTLQLRWTNAALATLSFGVAAAIYLDKLPQALATGLILIIVGCISFIIWAFIVMLHSFYEKGPPPTP